MLAQQVAAIAEANRQVESRGKLEARPTSDAGFAAAAQDQQPSLNERPKHSATGTGEQQPPAAVAALPLVRAWSGDSELSLESLELHGEDDHGKVRTGSGSLARGCVNPRKKIRRTQGVM